MIDYTALLQPLVEIAGTVIAALAVWAANKAINTLQSRTNVALTEQQRQTVLGAVQTAVGMVNVALAKGTLTLVDVHHTNPEIVRIASAALANVPDAAKALGVDPMGAAKIVVGRIGNALPPVGTP